MLRKITHTLYARSRPKGISARVRTRRLFDGVFVRLSNRARSLTQRFVQRLVQHQTERSMYRYMYCMQRLVPKNMTGPHHLDIMIAAASAAALSGSLAFLASTPV
jgi:hypothetical protein